MKCKFCGYDHGMIGDTICPLWLQRYNRNDLPLVDSHQDHQFTLELVLEGSVKPGDIKACPPGEYLKIMETGAIENGWYIRIKNDLDKMRTDRQEKILQALNRGKYIISVEDGKVYSRRVKGDGFKLLSPTVLPSGFLQYKIYLGEGMGMVHVYGHHLVWLSMHGVFPEKDDIVHLDKDKSNNGIGNLNKIERFIGEGREVTAAGIKTIRGAEIAKIRYMMEMGETNQSKIADELNLNRSSVRRTMKKISKGETFKYEEKDGQ